METIKTRKIVVLEELAAEYGIRTQEVIQRIHELEAQKRLTGVMDDRGKVRISGVFHQTITSCFVVFVYPHF